MTRAATTRRAFTLIEVVISTLIVSGLLVSSLYVVTASRAGDTFVADQARARMLAQDLLTEIMALPWEEPAAPGSFGPGPGEDERREFTDVDDYLNWTESPPQYRDGTEMADLAGWKRTVQIESVAAGDPDVAVDPGSTDFKLVTVTVYRNDKPLATLAAIRSPADLLDPETTP